MVSATLRFLLYVTDVKCIATYKLFGVLAATKNKNRNGVAEQGFPKGHRDFFTVYTV